MSKDDTNASSRRGVLKGSLGVVAAAAATAAARKARAQEKLAQNVVQYQETPKDGAKCSACVNFVEPAACKIVEGKINPNGWCVAYAPKG